MSNCDMSTAHHVDISQQLFFCCIVAQGTLEIKNGTNHY